MMRTKFSAADVVAVIAVLVCAALLFLLPIALRDTGETVLITTPNGQETYSLREDREISLTSNGITLVITIVNGEVCVTASDCPDRVCMQSGKISKSGETVVCAPAGVSVTVKGGAQDVDFVAG